MSERETEERSFEDWAAVMENLLYGDPEAREMALRKLVRLLSGFLGQLRAWDHEADWQDLRQTVLLKLVKSFREGNLRDPRAFVNYARTITRNEFYDFLRARRGEEIAELPHIAIEEPVEKELRQSLWTALSNLTEHHRLAVQTVYLEGKTYEEAAEVTGIPLGSLKRYLRLGLAQLREQLAGAL
jgi:RNA polymerase sigma factor (sigma-70 family)